MANQAAPTEVEQVEQYSAEDLALAQQEMNELTPAEYLALTSRIRDESKADKAALAAIPEAGSVIFTKLTSPNGVLYHLTARGTDCVSAIKNLAEGIRYAHARFGWEPVKEYGHQDSRPGPSIAPSYTAATPAMAPAGGIVSKPAASKKLAIGQRPEQAEQAQEPVYTDEGDQTGGAKPGVVANGTDVLNKIKVDDGRMMFSVGKFTYPFPDSRGAETWASLFDEGIGFFKEHFVENGVSYDPSDWGGVLYADWEAVEKFSNTKKKNVKYYNVLRVHR